MNDTPPNPELLRSLGRLVRGLSALFWGLPLALIICAGTGIAGWFKVYGFIPPLAATGLVLFGVSQLGAFQKQERPWRAALDRAQLLALIDFGLSPFLYWWNHVPGNVGFFAAVCVLAFSALLFLFDLNLVLKRLGAMLPDEALRIETRQFTALNRGLLLAFVVIMGTFFLISRNYVLPSEIGSLAMEVNIGLPLGAHVSIAWLFVALSVCLLILLPLAMTMALIWKTKEVILDSVFHPQG